MLNEHWLICVSFAFKYQECNRTYLSNTFEYPLFLFSMASNSTDEDRPYTIDELLNIITADTGGLTMLPSNASDEVYPNVFIGEEWVYNLFEHVELMRNRFSNTLIILGGWVYNLFEHVELMRNRFSNTLIILGGWVYNLLEHVELMRNRFSNTLIILGGWVYNLLEHVELMRNRFSNTLIILGGWVYNLFEHVELMRNSYSNTMIIQTLDCSKYMQTWKEFEMILRKGHIY